MDIKKNWVIIILAAFIAFVILWAWEHDGKALAASNFNRVAYASSTVANITTGAKTVMFWANIPTDLSDIFVWQDTDAGNGNFQMGRRGVTFHLRCDEGTTLDTLTNVKLGVWQHHSCSIDGSANVNYVILNLDGSVYMNFSGATTPLAGNETDLIIGANNGGAGQTNANIRNFMVVDSVLTVTQRRCFAFSKDPYQCGGGKIELVCPFTSQNDSRCFKPGKNINLSLFGASLYGAEPPLNIKVF